jgi:two-component system OmpR family sensor kinase
VSLRARLLAVLAALAIAGLLVADLVTYAALRSFLIDRVDRTLAAGARTLQRPMGPPRRGRDLTQLAELVPGMYVELRGPRGEVLGSGSLSRDAGAAVPELPARLPSGNFTAGDFRVRAQATAGGALVLAAPLDEVQGTLRRLALIMAVVSGLVVAAIVAAALWLVRLGLRPLSEIEGTAAAIAAGEYSRRIEEASPRTEVGRLGRSLNAMLAQIEAAFSARAASERRLRRFLADASHELRTPLSAVQAYAELFDRGARSRPDDLERAMAGISRESRRMGSLIDELLLLARLDEGRPLERAPVDLAAVAREAVEAARALEPERPLALDAAASAEVTGDRDRLRQVVDNLLANVRAHTPAATAASVRVARENGHVVLDVADQGPGLDDEQAARAFERFYRADPARARDRGGSGLGLAIVAAIAEASGGRASVESAPGEGARFRVELPAQAG